MFSAFFYTPQMSGVNLALALSHVVIVIQSPTKVLPRVPKLPEALCQMRTSAPPPPPNCSETVIQIWIFFINSYVHFTFKRFYKVIN